MIADEIRELDKNGKLKLFLKSGVIPIKIKVYYEIFNHFENELKANKKCNDCIMTSVSNTATSFNVHGNTVRKAVKLMKL